ncbi:hypothetical protein KIS4809_5309 [Bacillus sp. ZZV12-4809]|nr:hypothetical protein KIS4809_5309 [Bacillus sp. ZZV12-4809]
MLSPFERVYFILSPPSHFIALRKLVESAENRLHYRSISSAKSNP